MAGRSEAVQLAEDFVREEIRSCGVDSSHDWWHISRVRTLALKLADEEQLPGESLEVVELAALLHDIKDWKYSKDAGAGSEAVKAFLDAKTNLTDAAKQRIVYIVKHIGFKDEVNGPLTAPSPELCVVQDADRLDAIGAIGVARCLTFGGRMNRVLHDPNVPARAALTREEYMNSAVEQTTINHFHEKLLKLRGMMKTRAGRARADARHQFMEQFLAQFHSELDGSA
mmetsp:Transcript_6328/g.16285  ORF Transcript_6328/g.16285 Transcript_6328/m.16285 type:complete len:227 (-) Transcript_6328:193-873(-)|eukprot:jgi/Tetstr1/424331/TSEL_014897.t1